MVGESPSNLKYLGCIWTRLRTNMILPGIESVCMFIGGFSRTTARWRQNFTTTVRSTNLNKKAKTEWILVVVDNVVIVIMACCLMGSISLTRRAKPFFEHYKAAEKVLRDTTHCWARVVNIVVLAQGRWCSFVAIRACKKIATRIANIATCITKVALELVHYALLIIE